MKYINKNWKVPMSNLQLFADGDGAGAGGNGGGDGGDEGGQGGATLTFDDFLKQGDNQAEFDRRVQKATNTAVTNAVAKEKEKWETLANENLSEAEKLAKMTKQEQMEYKNQKLEEKIAKMERKEARIEITKEARKILTEKGINISDDLLDRIVSDDAEETKKSVEDFSKLFNDAVGETVKAKARQDTPGEGGDSGSPAQDKLDIGKLARETRIIK